jgi:hypothetical protein
MITFYVSKFFCAVAISFMKEDGQGANGFPFSNEQIATSPLSVLVNENGSGGDSQ